MKIKQWFTLFAVICSILLLAACGSNSGSGGDQTAAPAEDNLGSDAGGVEYVGAAVCIGCHEDFSWSATEVADYLAGKHVNNHSGSYGYDYMVENGCDSCHDPIGDSAALTALQGGDELVTVGCENCHGAGGDHYGVGPVQMAKPDYTTCAGCHDELPDSHLTYHPEADFIGTNYQASRHFTASVRSGAICSKCHTDEGGKLYKGVSTRDQLEVTVMAVDSEDPVQCRTCHNPHNAGGLLMDEVESRGNVIASAEYATCVTCHMAPDAAVADDGAGGTDWDVTEAIYHQDVYYRIITDTHSDDPATTDMIEGYVIDPTSDRACRDCHDVHSVVEIRADEDSSSFSNTLHDQWSKSGHGGYIGDIKLAKAEEYDDLGKNRTTEQTVAIKVAAVDGDDNAFPHYDWDATTEYNADDDLIELDRGGCQVCHTATGIKNFMSNPDAYDPLNNDFSHLADWDLDGGPNGETVSSGQNELLYCWGCHSNNSGALRNAGALTLVDKNDVAMGTLPDLGNSNICAKCHGGRGNNTTVRDSSRSSRFQGHHAPTAGTVFSDILHIAYEFDGQSYANVPFFAHDDIGLNSDSPETGSGPCAGCHMPSSDHTFAAVVEDEGTGEITAITNQALCNTCHTGDYVMTPAILEEEKEGFDNAVVLFGAYITNVLPNNAGVDISGRDAEDTPYYQTVSFENYGAFQNWKYMQDDPCSYVHNRFYAKRIIFDSIDWLDNGALDGTITIDETVYPAAAVWLGADADTNLASRP